jgi:hypothetical protein
MNKASFKQHLQQIVEAAPQLQELWVNSFDTVKAVNVIGRVACLTGLRSLGSLQLKVVA